MKLKFKKLFLVLPFVFAIGLSGCASKKTESPDPLADSETMAQEDDTEAEAVDAGAESDASSGIELYSDSDSGKAGALTTVYFPFDSSRLTADTKANLESNYQFLADNANLRIQVEGHCDERGSVQYNLALGQRRAKAIKDYLVSKGISSDRISTVSYGKERPIEFGHSESAWAKNRRGNFVIVEK